MHWFVSLCISVRIYIRAMPRVRLSGYQIFLTIIVGTVGGVYIWKPELEKRYVNVSQEDLDADRQRTLEDFDKEG